MSHNTRALCKGTNARGEPCKSFMINLDGYCPAHREGGKERLSEIGKKGAAATARVWASEGFSVEELPPLTSLEDARDRLDVIGRAVLCRKISHAEGNAASKAASEWVKAESAVLTQRLVGELEKTLHDKETEIQALRRQLVAPGGRVGRPRKAS